MAHQAIKNKLSETPSDPCDLLGCAKAPSDWKVQGLWDSAKAYFLSRVFLQRRRPLFIVCAGRQEAEKWVENLKTCLASAPNAEPLLLEGWELPIVSEKPSLENASERSRVLEALLYDREPTIVVATLSGALQFLLPKEHYAKMRRKIAHGDALDLQEFIQMLLGWGYERVAMVEKKGDFTVHGGIVDVYPVASNNPLRVELGTDGVESLRYFDAISQRSCEATQTVVLHAANEWTLLRDASTGLCVTHFLDKNALVVLDEPLELAAMEERTRTQDGLVPIPRLGFSEWMGGCKDRARVALCALPQALAGWEQASLVELQSQPMEMAVDQAGVAPMDAARSLARDPKWILASVRQWMSEGMQGTFVFQNEGEEKRFFEWAKENELDKSWLKQIHAVRGDMQLGFVSPSFNSLYVTDQDIFGRAKIRRSVKRFHGTSPLGDFSELQVGDLVVHQRHGIGRYLGVRRIAADTQKAGEKKVEPGEYLSIEYAEAAKLHVPLDQAYLVCKYMGVGDRVITLDQLGSKRWENTKARVLAATMRVAKELLEVQAARQSLEGIPYSKDTRWQTEFENAFAYEETVDQVTSIAAVKKDMEGSQPMDRLICGDVGYGKTEVAIRAAFKAVMDHRQVAVLVPTTILAQQHLLTFSGRMADYPVRVEMLSRFRHPAEIRKILLDLVEGKIDIIIGTHRLLQPDIRFKDLGLVIVDEEQRFGVKHKETFKKLRRLVDVLTLSATPIPRTLYLSLLGTKEMSTINTPPADRLPVETILAQYSDDLVRRVIRYELAREGQVYFVHNRVKSIERVQKQIKKLVPEARIVSAHGQMDEDSLSDIMGKFVAGKIDVLVTTTIIESGLDIPNANTLIVDDADRFGLSELYQLRGRVGRFKNKAYAYFLLPQDKVLLEAAKKRLKAIHDFTALGSGFRIAMRDLEIRGAGNILGHQQHGHIAAVGFDLYCQLLKTSIARLKSMPLPKDEEVIVKIGADLVIPVNYVPSEDMRMDLYRRISAASDEQHVVSLREEVMDRFGKPPAQVDLFLEVANVRVIARRKGVFFIERKDGKWFLRKEKETVTQGGSLPRSQARNAKEAVAEIKNVLSKLPDASTI